jgi:hypothetical protein
MTQTRRLAAILAAAKSGRERLTLIRLFEELHGHQARIPRHVGGEDRGEAVDRGHFLARR